MLAALEAEPSLTVERLTQLVSTEISAASAELSARFLTSFLQVDGIDQLARDQAKHPQADRAFLQQLQGETLQAVLAFATEVVERGTASDTTFHAVAEYLSPREIVELLLAIGFYSTVAMLTETTGIELDEPVGLKVVESAKR